MKTLFRKIFNDQLLKLKFDIKKCIYKYIRSY